MTGVTELFQMRRASSQDERARLNLLPAGIKLARGSVTGAEGLLEDRPEQAFLGRAEACTMENTKDGEKAGLLFDFGREYNGTLRITTAFVKSPDHRAKLRIRFGESVMEALTPLGEKNTTNDHAVRDHVYDIGSLGTVETGESGFRFAYLELQDEEAALSLQAVHLCFIFRDIPYRGSFSCDDPLLEKIWKTAAYTVHLNMQNYLWDGIKRDRLAWQGDLHTEVLTCEDVFGANPVVPQTLDFLRDHTPEGEWINGYSSYSLWWVKVQADWYRYTGDLDYLREQGAFLKAQLHMAADCVNEDGSERLPEFRFLDWKNVGNETSTHAGLQGLMTMAIREGAWLLECLGEQEEAALFRGVLKKLEAHVPDCGGVKQAAALLSLSGLEDAGKLNREVIQPGGAHGYSTFMGYYLLAAKAKAGDWRGALDDLRAYWGGMLQMGATTFWEDFDLDWMENAGRIDEVISEGKKDIHGDFGAYCYVKFRHSLCHGWSSGPVPFLMRHVMGISIAEPGCRKLRITPHLGGLKYACATYPVPQGIVSVRHTVQADGSVKTEFEAPEGVEVVIGEEG